MRPFHAITATARCCRLRWWCRSEGAVRAAVVQVHQHLGDPQPPRRRPARRRRLSDPPSPDRAARGGRTRLRLRRLRRPAGDAVQLAAEVAAPRPQQGRAAAVREPSRSVTVVVVVTSRRVDVRQWRVHGARAMSSLSPKRARKIHFNAKKVAHTRLPSDVGFWSRSRFLAVSLQVT